MHSYPLLSSFPPFNFTAVLTLNDNNLNGTIPSEIGNCHKLEVLGLHNNTLTGTLPSDLGRLVNLVTLLLGRNQLNGTVPQEICNLSQQSMLERLEATYCVDNFFNPGDQSSCLQQSCQA